MTLVERQDDQLTGADHARLYRLEQVVERGLGTFVEVGKALMEIRDTRLYRADYTSFEDYCFQRWQMSRPQAYRMMQSAEVVAALSPIGDLAAPLPATESQARELAPLLAEPELLREVWQETVERAQQEERFVTAAQVRETVKARRLPSPAAAEKQAKETGLAVLGSDGYWAVPNPTPPEQSVFVEVEWWWEQVEKRFPAAHEFVCPDYGRATFYPAAKALAAYLTTIVEREPK